MVQDEEFPRWTVGEVLIPITDSVSEDTFRGLQVAVINHVESMGGVVKNRTTAKRIKLGGDVFRALTFSVSTPRSDSWDEVTCMSWIINTLRGALLGYSNRISTTMWPDYETVQTAYETTEKFKVGFWRLLQVGELPEELTNDEKDMEWLDN